MYVGGFGSGKTLAGCHEALHVSLKYPGNFGLIGAQTYPQLRDTTRRTFFEICPDELIKNWNKSENLLTFINGSELIFRSLDDDSKFKSLNLGWFYIDEGTDVPESVFKMLQSRLRLKVPGHSAWITTNPDTFGNWVYQRFVENPTEQYGLVNTTTLDNPYLPEEYIKDLKDSYDDDYYRRYVMGQWGNLEGLVYKNFDINVHVQDIPHTGRLTKYRSIDHGYTNPFVCLWGAVDGDGRYFITDEIYERKQLVSDLAVQIKNKHTGDHITFADPSEAEGNATLRKAGIVPSQTKNDVIQGIQAVQKLLKVRGDGKPGLIIHPRCKNLIKEFQLYKWRVSDGRVNDKEEPMKLNDHAMDALRYFIYSTQAHGAEISIPMPTPRIIPGYGTLSGKIPGL